jgi:hypothetical protein
VAIDVLRESEQEGVGRPKRVPAAFVAAIASGVPVEAAGAQLGISRSSAYRLLERDDVRDEVTRARESVRSFAPAFRSS